MVFDTVTSKTGEMHAIYEGHRYVIDWWCQHR